MSVRSPYSLKSHGGSQITATVSKIQKKTLNAINSRELIHTLAYRFSHLWCNCLKFSKGRGCQNLIRTGRNFFQFISIYSVTDTDRIHRDPLFLDSLGDLQEVGILSIFRLLPISDKNDNLWGCILNEHKTKEQQQ